MGLKPRKGFSELGKELRSLYAVPIYEGKSDEQVGRIMHEDDSVMHGRLEGGGEARGIEVQNFGGNPVVLLYDLIDGEPVF